MFECRSISPNTGRLLSSWHSPDDTEVSRCIDRLDKGGKALVHDFALRTDVLERFQAALARAHDELVALTVAECGKTPTEAAAELVYAGSFIDTAHDLLASHPFSSQLDAHRTVIEVPRGHGLLVAPYNDPVAGLTRKIAPCLAAGACAIVKPSGLGVLCALALGRAMKEEGLDDFIAILSISEHERIARLLAHDAVGTVSFTGSTEVGLELAMRAATNAKGFVGELGGTNPFVILSDADINRAVTDLVARKLRAAGQACSAQNIVYAERAIYEEVVARVAAAFESVQHGAADAPDVSMGPVRTASAVNNLAQAADRLVQEGGQLICGGVTRYSGDGPFLVAPTALRTEAAGLLAEEELFGPVLGIAPFDDRQILRNILARNRQALALYVYGENMAAIDSLLHGLRYGSIGVNTTAIQGAQVPTGGFRRAGIGREGGHWGLSEFLTTINIRTERP